MERVLEAAGEKAQAQTEGAGSFVYLEVAFQPQDELIRESCQDRSVDNRMKRIL